MNTIIVISWWARTAVVFFTDIDDFYMLDIGKNRTLRGAKSYIRGELCGKHGVALSHIKTVKDTPPVTFLLAKRVERSIDMWYFIITNDGFQVFEILPDCVKPSGMFYTTSLKASLDGILSHIRSAYAGVDVRVDIDNATFDMDSTMVGMVKAVLV